jgi:hypothetical protein
VTSMGTKTAAGAISAPPADGPSLDAAALSAGLDVSHVWKCRPNIFSTPYLATLEASPWWLGASAPQPNRFRLQVAAASRLRDLPRSIAVAMVLGAVAAPRPFVRAEVPRGVAPEDTKVVLGIPMPPTSLVFLTVVGLHVPVLAASRGSVWSTSPSAGP